MQSKIFYPIILLGVIVLTILDWLGFGGSWGLSLVTVLFVLGITFSSVFLGTILLIVFSVLDIFPVFGLRSYHWVILALVVIYGFNFLKKEGGRLGFWRLGFLKRKIKETTVSERLLFLLLLSSLLGLFNATSLGYSLRQTVVFVFSLLIFGLIFWFLRSGVLNFVKLSEAISYSLLPVGLLALYQNIAHEKDWPSFEVMSARPNATFYEPDWLGMYLVLVLPFVLYLLFLGKKNRNQKIFFWIILTFLFVILIITVARASWLAGLVEISFLFLWFFWGMAWGRISLLVGRSLLTKLLAVVLILGLALGLVNFFNLTRFDLADRLTSIYKKEHIVTVAIDPLSGVKTKIDLEEIETYRTQGFDVIEEKVIDENVTARLDSYASNRSIIAQHWFLGHGQGGALIQKGLIHNANNIFYEFWIANGLLGVLSFLSLLGFVIWQAMGVTFLGVKRFSALAWTRRGLILAGILGLVVVNLFNAGIYFPLLWIFLGASAFWAEKWQIQKKVGRK